MSIDERVRAAAAALKAADALLITAGAGMGVDSGLPDFRGRHGFWRAYPVIAKLGLSFEEMANPAWFSANPHLAWAFYGQSTDPNVQGMRRLTEMVAAESRVTATAIQTVGTKGYDGFVIARVCS